MASEHDLEFVDLDTYGVDPAAGEILPADLARRHHVVAVKRKFGTPVIATADPDDLFAQETVRSAIGRDFISVVASRDQISAYLDQLFGREVDEDRTSDASTEMAAGPVDIQDAATTLAEDPDVSESAVITTESSEGIDSLFPESFPEAFPEPESELPEPGAESGVSEPGAESGVSEPGAADDAPEAGGAGKRRRKRDEAKRKELQSRVEEQDEAVLVDDREQDIPTEDFVDAVAALDGITSGEMTDPFMGSSDRSAEAVADPLSLHDPFSESVAFAAEGGDTAADVAGQTEILEPAGALLPEFDSAPEASWAGSADVVTPPVDPLAELARSVQDDEESPPPDSAALAADLVAEAVATFQEQQGEEQDDEAPDIGSGGGTSVFPPLAKALVNGDRVSLEDMQRVLEEHYQSGQSIARILTAQNLVTEADLMWGMAEEMGLEFVDLDTVGVDLAEAGTIPEATARHHNVMVIANDNGTPVVAASNPTDVFAMDDLRTIMGRNFIVVVATRTQISAYIGRAFNSGGDAADMAMEASLGFDGNGGDESVDDIQAVTEEAPIVRYVNLLILQALNERASDVHVEPTSTDLRIRYRIDGVLHDVSTAPRTISAAVITRLKVMADMNVAEHRIPQDGRISLNVGSKGIDLRMATLPTIHGEKVVMRVLDKSSVVLGFPDLGFDEDLLKTYEGIYTKPYGTILVTGPTGSGKSTTLYTTLTALNSPEKNIITVEDPVELQLKGVNQVQLNVKAGLTFASALKSILRSDPDIVLVGEIRDKETAVIAIEAALTGHMVLATLHTNSAAATPMRLIEMGIEPFLVTSSLSGVLAQRLARRLCMHCKEAYEPTEADITAAGWTVEEVEAAGGMPKVHKAVGCSACANTGYRGRKALAELLPMTEEIERAIIEGGSVEDIHRIAVSQGMLTLRQSGLRKAIEGETTLEEVLRVVA
jgi:type IV pilus assembly protein PilB